MSPIQLSVIRSINFLAMICQTPDGADVSNVFGSRRKSHVGGFRVERNQHFPLSFPFYFNDDFKASWICRELPGYFQQARYHGECWQSGYIGLHFPWRRQQRLNHGVSVRLIMELHRHINSTICWFWILRPPAIADGALYNLR